MYVYIPEVRYSDNNTWVPLDLTCVYSKKEDAWTRIERELKFVINTPEFFGKPGKGFTCNFIKANGLYFQITVDKKDHKLTTTYRVSTYWLI